MTVGSCQRVVVGFYTDGQGRVRPVTLSVADGFRTKRLSEKEQRKIAETVVKGYLRNTETWLHLWDEFHRNPKLRKIVDEKERTLLSPVLEYMKLKKAGRLTKEDVLRLGKLARDNGLLKLENRELKDQWIWTLYPVKTCKGATPYCRSVCYAQKSYTTFNPHSVAHKIARVRIARRPDFAEIMDAYIQLLKDYHKLRKRARFPKVVRLHEAGDFFDVNYYRAWVKVARRHPDITFYTFTRVRSLPFREKPENFRIIYSLDYCNICRDLNKVGGVDGYSFIWDPKIQGEPTPSRIPRGWHLCPKSVNKDVECGRDCTYCFTAKNPRVIFRKH